MCGIAGLIAPQLMPADRETVVRRMIARQRHRGPDDLGLVSQANATLGMCRLAIIDPAHGHQPMSSPDGRHHLVFNGAIYNFRALQSELTAHGWVFRTNCDTEVLLAMLVRHGVAALPRLRGMFAFAWWDAQERRLIAARDQFGIKPFYYARRPEGGLLFASELNALIASGLIDREIDPASAGEFLAWFSVPAPRTIYRGIDNLTPGHLLTADNTGRMRTDRWWNPPAAQTSRVAASGDFTCELRHQLEDTIRAHRVADVPVGAFLSGGLDSTAIAALMTRTGATKLKTFTIVFEEAAYSERDQARLAARAIGAEHHEELLTGRRVADDLPKLLGHFDSPTGDGINTFYASQAAREGGVKVVLSGLGGDELFGGYPSFRDLPRLQKLLPLWRGLPTGLRHQIIGLLRNRPSARAAKLADFLAHARDLHELAALQRRVLPEARRLSLLTPEARAAAKRLGPFHPMLDDFIHDLAGADAAQIISAWEMRTYMADVLLRDSDVFGMANSIELRVPFIDHVLLDWLWPQPAAEKIREPGGKAALADATADLVPAVIRHRRKQGFTLPFARWMHAELRPFLEETFSSNSLANCAWLEAGAISRLWQDFLAGRDPRAWSRVWTIAMLVAFANRRPSA
jgi:asparagine synthase (glutamine-hydrolysing)